MVLRKITAACSCSLSLNLSLNLFPTLLFLHSILPSTSYAQVTDPSNTSTFQTSTVLPSPNSTPSSTQTQQNASSPTSTDGSTSDGRSPNGTFNFYFIIVAIVIIIFILSMLYLGKRKKQKAALMRRNSQRALAEDMEGLRDRFGMGRGGMRRAHAGGGGSDARRGRMEGLEGLNDVGEAPPPYRPASKPPSLRSGDAVGVREIERSETREGQVVEMNTMSTEAAMTRQDPPGYGHDMSANGGGNARWEDMDMARPAPAVTAPPRRNGSTD
ncbi:hypothetical protein VTL71DRAFT_12537 [Oculimacula yallundae]|uniref:Uncharacterized protein n=1 Tax=Oculimacula yallundae TaxID=86028 RepID=A0ABR4CMU4_9HELO